MDNWIERNDIDETLPHFDGPLFRKVLEWVEVEAARPEATREWNQKQWFAPIVNNDGATCGTAYCFAGYTAHATGWNMVSGGLCAKDGKTDFIADVAARALGLTGYEADELFEGHNDIKRVRKISALILDRRGEVL